MYYRHGKTQFDANEQPEAATVAYVHSDTTINLSVVDHNGVQFPATSVFLYQGDGDRPQRSYAEWTPTKPDAEQGRLNRQLSFMRIYSGILADRIAAF